jgi:hypothetical protein
MAGEAATTTGSTGWDIVLEKIVFYFLMLPDKWDLGPRQRVH